MDDAECGLVWALRPHTTFVLCGLVVPSSGNLPCSLWPSSLQGVGNDGASYEAGTFECHRTCMHEQRRAHTLERQCACTRTRTRTDTFLLAFCCFRYSSLVCKAGACLSQGPPRLLDHCSGLRADVSEPAFFFFHFLGSFCTMSDSFSHSHRWQS